jgi:hypothetical protein
MRQSQAIFSNQMDFLDGDELFRGLHNIADMFVDHNKDLAPLVASGKVEAQEHKRKYQWANISEHTATSVVVPKNYDVHSVNRAPIVMLGYNAFSRKPNDPYFTGPHVGEAIIERPDVFQYFNRIKDHVEKAFILMHGANENWGIFSTEFPNRTVDWGYCCQGNKNLPQLLNHKKLVMFLHTQHHNITHPKLITLPRGVAISWERKRSILWDLIHTLPDTTPKSSLAFTASSNWKHRPYISKCVKSKFVTDLDKKSLSLRMAGGKARVTGKEEWDYYRRLATARTCIALPGLGYDTFRYALHPTFCLMFLGE